MSRGVSLCRSCLGVASSLLVTRDRHDDEDGEGEDGDVEDEPGVEQAPETRLEETDRRVPGEYAETIRWVRLLACLVDSNPPVLEPVFPRRDEARQNTFHGDPGVAQDAFRVGHLADAPAVDEAGDGEENDDDEGEFESLLDLVFRGH